MKLFLSHNTKDKEIVESIGSWLSNKGHSVWIDNWRMSPGDSLIEKIGEGIEESDKLIVFLSPNSVDSNWVKKEIATGLILELAEEKGLGSKFVIPVVIRPCKIPIMLRDKLYANFIDKEFNAACEELENGITNKQVNYIDKKLENRIYRRWNRRLGNGKYATLLEFGVKLSPTHGLHIGFDCGTNYTKYEEWFNLPNTIDKPQNIGVVFTNSAIRVEPPLFARKFETPGLSTTRSYYLYLESDSEFKIYETRFQDFYDREL